MSLNITTLENVVVKAGKTTARCPACAKDGGDSHGGHLVIYPTGRYSCVAFPNSPEHRKAIYQLNGGAKTVELRDMVVTIKPKAIDHFGEGRVLKRFNLLKNSISNSKTGNING